MTAASLIREARSKGVELWFEGPRLRARAPRDTMTPAMRQAFAAQRTEVVAELRAEAGRAINFQPMSFAQRGMWFTQLQDPSSSANIIGSTLQLSGRIDEDALVGVLQALVDRHATLRTTYVLQDGEPMQRIAGHVPLSLERVSMPGASDADVTHWIERDQRTPFDLEHGPMLRCALLKRDHDCILVTSAHHISLDAWSLAILLGDFLALYSELSGGAPAALSRPKTYAEYASWHNSLVQGPSGERFFESWRAMLAPPIEPLQLPLDRPRPAVRNFEGGAVPFTLDTETMTRLGQLARDCHTTTFVLLLGCFHMLVARLSAAKDVIVGIPVFGRNRSEDFGTVGDFVNSLPIRLRFDPQASAKDTMARFGQTMIDALDTQEYPFALLVQRLRPPRDAGGFPLFNTFCTLIDFKGVGLASGLHAKLMGDDSVEIGGMNVVSWPLDRQAGLFDLSLELIESAGAMRCKLKFARDLFNRTSVERFVRSYVEIVQGLIDDPDARMAGFIGVDEEASTLLESLVARGIRLSVQGDEVQAGHPLEELDEATQAAIATHRDGIIALLADRDRRDAADAAARATATANYWRAELAEAPAVLDLATDRPRTPYALPQEAYFQTRLDGPLIERLQNVARVLDVSLDLLLMAGWLALLHRLSGQTDLVVGWAAGPAMLPIRSRPDGNPPFDAFLASVRDTVRAAEEHGGLSPAALSALFADDHAAAARPLFLAQFAHRGESFSAATHTNPVAPERDLAVDIIETPDGVRLRYSYAGALFDQQTIARLHDNYAHLLAGIAAGSSSPILALPLYDATAEATLWALGAGADLEHDRALCAHHLLAASAERAPDSIAVSGPGGSLTYAAFEARANRLAHLLAARGAGRGTLVAVCVERTIDMPVALAAVLKAGAAYVPLDPGHPASRLRYIIEDAGAVCVVTVSQNAAMFEGMPTICLDADQTAIEAQESTPPRTGVVPSDLAYVIYTSGSTGRPKGVEVEHRNLVAFLQAMRKEPGMGPSDVLLAVTTPSFDIAGLELWLPLTVGARVVIASRAQAIDAHALAACIVDQGVTVLQATPATWRLLIEGGWRGDHRLKALCGGEAMPQALARELIARVGQLWNMYGPTETTIWSTAARVTDAAGPVSIGRPIAGTQVHVLDAAGRPAPIGVVGELVIGGEGVTRGYHNRPDLTAAAFVELPVAGGIGRIYRTGDLARLRSDGSLDYLGRRDLQVKVRGYRIELGEIETRLAELPGVTGGVVALKSPAPGDDRLVGYVTLAEGAQFDAQSAREALHRSLPEYMVPAHIIAVPAFPLSPSRKVDRAALPMPSRPSASAASAVPMSDAQTRVARLWQTVLQVDQVGLDDNFFDLGGHSLLLVKLQAALVREFGVPLPLVELFQYTTVAAQAGRLVPEGALSDPIARARARSERRKLA